MPRAKSQPPFNSGESIVWSQVPRDVRAKLREAARTSDRSISGQIRAVRKPWAAADHDNHQPANAPRAE